MSFFIVQYSIRSVKVGVEYYFFNFLEACFARGEQLVLHSASSGLASVAAMLSRLKELVFLVRARSPSLVFLASCY